MGDFDDAKGQAFEREIADSRSEHDRMLAGQDVPRDINTPIEGWYRVKQTRPGGKEVFVPVRYQYVGDFDALECYIDGRKVDAQRALEQWSWASANPVTEEAYRNALNGHPWPDVDATVHAAANGSPPALGDNKPPEAQLLDRVMHALAGLTVYARWHVGDANAENKPATLISATQSNKIAYLIGDDDVRDRAQSLRDLLLKLKSEAEKAHKTEKAPHLEAGRLIDRKWFDIRDLAEAGANAIRAAMSAWETAKFQKQRVAQEVARKAQEAAEKAGAPIPAPVALPPPPAAPARIKGGSGKAASVSTITQVQSVTDWAALAAFMCLQPDVQSALLKVANAMLKADATAKIPGVVTQQVRDVK